MDLSDLLDLDWNALAQCPDELAAFIEYVAAALGFAGLLLAGLASGLRGKR